LTYKEEKWKSVQNDHLVRVTYRDTDQMNVVYYANYLVWFEMGRTELLRQTGHTYKEFEDTGHALPVIHCVCEYKKPARYDDLIRIRTRILHLSRASIIFGYQIINENTGEVIAEGETRHAIITKEGRIARAGNMLEQWFEQEILK